jgi:hypothetical protein
MPGIKPGMTMEKSTQMDNALAQRCDLRCSAVDRPAAIEMAEHHGAGHHHHGRGHTAKNESQEPQACPIGHHDTPHRSFARWHWSQPNGRRFNAKQAKSFPSPDQGLRGAAIRFPRPAPAEEGKARMRPRSDASQIQESDCAPTAWRRRWTPCRPADGRWRSTASPGQSWWCGRRAQYGRPPARRN